MSGLVLKLGPKERLLINGAVIENGDRRSRVTVLTSNAKILRLKDAIHPNEATTPVKRACYLTQLLLSGNINPNRIMAQLFAQMDDLGYAFTDEHSISILSVAKAHLNEENPYGCLKSLRRLLPLEAHLLGQLQ
jgi:flagellar protein FlbT